MIGQGAVSIAESKKQLKGNLICQLSYKGKPAGEVTLEVEYHLDAGAQKAGGGAQPQPQYPQYGGGYPAYPPQPAGNISKHFFIF